jgi:hypothetical protein
MNKKKSWTYELCREEALKFNTIEEYSKKSNVSYQVVCKNGWNDSILKHLERKQHPKSYWTIEKCIDIAKKYDKMYKLEEGHSTAYKVICENKWNGIIKQYLINNDNIERQPS